MDTDVHVAAYALLGAPVRVFCRDCPSSHSCLQLVLGASLGGVYGVMDKAHRHFVPSRHATHGMRKLAGPAAEEGSSSTFNRSGVSNFWTGFELPHLPLRDVFGYCLRGGKVR